MHTATPSMQTQTPSAASCGRTIRVILQHLRPSGHGEVAHVDDKQDEELVYSNEVVEFMQQPDIPVLCFT